jgi:hypothetical protein
MDGNAYGFWNISFVNVAENSPVPLDILPNDSENLRIL